jgi:DNA-binding Lrp family transcriptional regulator
VISAIVLVNTEIGEEKQVLQKINYLEGVEEAHALTGLYDLLIKVNAKSVDNLRDHERSLRKLSGVSNLSTLMITGANK